MSAAPLVQQPASGATADSGGHLPDILEAMKMALRSLRTNLFRTVLTLLGIIIGVGAVVAMLAIGDGSKASVLSRIEAMGTDLLVVRPGARNVRTPGDSATLVAEDADAIARAAERARKRARVWQRRDRALPARATTPPPERAPAPTTHARATGNWPTALSLPTATSPVMRRSSCSAATVANNLFRDGESPLGKYVLVNNIPFQVVGVLAGQGRHRVTAPTWTTTCSCRSPRRRMRLFGRRFVRCDHGADRRHHARR